MEPDNSLAALVNPGEADNFFDIDGLADLQPGSTAAFDRINALWLAEFCRLIYRQENDEVPRPNTFKTRDAFLRDHGWQEQAFFNLKGTQAGLFLKPNQCAALIFRGTLGLQDDITDVEFAPDQWDFGGKVHGGFKEAFQAVWKDDLKAELLALNLPLFVTGHSLGAALGTLAWSACLNDPKLKGCRPAALYTIGSPRVGDANFSQTLAGLFHCRLVNDQDIVPTVPPTWLVLGMRFQHVGQLHQLTPDEPLRVFPNNFDPGVTNAIPVDLLGPISSLAATIAGLPGALLEPPLPLRDHTPVNYTAAIELATEVVPGPVP